VDTPDFFLASSEGCGLEVPRRCYRIRRIFGRNGDDYLLVRVDPPIIGQRYGTPPPRTREPRRLPTPPRIHGPTGRPIEGRVPAEALRRIR